MAVVLVLQNASQENVLTAAAVVVIGCLGIFLFVKTFRRLPHEFRTEDDQAENSAGGGGRGEP